LHAAHRGLLVHAAWCMPSSRALRSGTDRQPALSFIEMVLQVNDSVSLANQLRPILLRLARHLRNETHTRGVTGGQVSLLVAIEFHPGITGQELADREGLSAPGVS